VNCGKAEDIYEDDSGFLELVDEAAEFVRNNKYEDFVLVDPRQELSLS
jgi:hypothetical protein